MALSEAELAVLIFGLAIFCILVLSVMIYCTFRARLRKENYPVYVIPCDHSSAPSTSAFPYISAVRDISDTDESVQLRRYTRLKEVRRQRHPFNFSAFENPSYISDTVTQLPDRSNMLNVNTAPVWNGRTRPVSESGSPENSQKIISKNSDLKSSSKGNPYLPEDEIAVRLERSSMIRSKSNQDYRTSFASCRSSPELGTVSPSSSLNACNNNNNNNNYYLHSSNCNPIPALKLSRDLAEAIAYDKVQENSVSFHPCDSGNSSFESMFGKKDAGHTADSSKDRKPHLNASMEIVCKQRTVV